MTESTARPEPPRLVTELHRRIDDLCVNRREVVVEHRFKRSDPSWTTGGAVLGWESALTPVDGGVPVRVWYDGYDEDLSLLLSETYWFGWYDLEDGAAVVSEIVGICAGVMSGMVWEWRTRRRKGCDVVTPDGRRYSATDGRLRGLSLGRDRERSRSQMPAYGSRRGA